MFSEAHPRQPSKILLPLKIFGLLALYALLADISGGINTDLGQLYFEIPLVMLCASLLYPAIKTERGFRAFWAVLPFLLYYLFMDIYYANLGRVFKWVEVTDLPLLLDVMPTLGVVVLGLIVVTILLLLHFSLNYQKLHWCLFAALPIAAVVGTMSLAPSGFAQSFESFARKIYIDEKTTTGQNGRLITPLYFESKRQSALTRIEHTPGWAQDDIQRHARSLDGLTKRNIHLIIMESWVDPNLFGALNTADKTTPDNFLNLPKHQNISISPVFGGQTPQAEFELLCGTPALAQLSSIEFNLFSGSTTSCLPNWLAEAGWRTIASHAYKPTFFNRGNAYRSVGFNELHFPADYKASANTYLKKGLVKNEPYMFDGDILQANLKFVEEAIAQDQPILNYVLGVYGHWPNEFNAQRFEPLPLASSIADNDQVRNIINQYYYRTEALADYLQKLMTIDPNSLILVMSDHLPPFPSVDNWQQTLGYFPENTQGAYKNIYYLWDGRQPITVDEPMSHNRLLSLLFSEWSGEPCSLPFCTTAEPETRYQNLLSSAIFEYR